MSNHTNNKRHTNGINKSSNPILSPIQSDIEKPPKLPTKQNKHNTSYDNNEMDVNDESENDERYETPPSLDINNMDTTRSNSAKIVYKSSQSASKSKQMQTSTNRSNKSNELEPTPKSILSVSSDTPSNLSLKNPRSNHRKGPS